ncbi:Dabb family protein [Flavihumibacter sp. RY-1]|uniref:Dabb family protein n=1 Tax=Flavihumibacter fluminis TaxID=2909236 RepID=A0ABS9BLN1_9BACT|nr:Dabb family protein [Flavihumibacter fluminis]MCF1715749.1 Dabb family protein [Flavihumibacter fluminis]
MYKFITLVFISVLMSTTIQAQTKQQHHRQLRHVVLFSFKPGSSAADIKKVEDAFRALPSKIPQIKGFEWGTNNSPEGLDQGFTHCFFLTFNSEKDREIYLPHPDHKAFGAVLKPHLEKVLVIDYWAEK